MEPWEGVSCPPISFNKVVLPVPLGPIIAVTLPRGISRLILLKIFLEPQPKLIFRISIRLLLSDVLIEIILSLFVINYSLIPMNGINHNAAYYSVNHFPAQQPEPGLILGSPLKNSYGTNTETSVSSSFSRLNSTASFDRTICLILVPCSEF